MRCIFCKEDSSRSREVEHIIPECLGNKEHLLPAGIVCDSCNNYFGLKVEKPLLDSHYFRQARFRNSIYNKDDRIPTIQGALLPGIIPIEMILDKDGTGLFPTRETDQEKLIDLLETIQKGKIIFPMVERPDEQLMSRFLAKVVLEVLASRVLSVPGGLDEMIEKSELDELRHYARFGAPSRCWPLNMRVIYPERKLFVDGVQRYEILHEFKLLHTESCELYSDLTPEN